MALTLVYVTTDYPPDRVASGIGTYTRAVAEGMAQRGHRVHVVSRLDGAGEPAAATDVDCTDVTVHRVGPARFPLPRRTNAGTLTHLLATAGASEIGFRRRLATFVHELVDRTGADVVESADSAAEMLFFDPARHRGIPFVVRLHGPTAVHDETDQNVPRIMRVAVGAVERRFVLRATHLTCPSQVAADRTRQVLRLPMPRIHVFPNPPNERLMPSTAPAPEARDPMMVLFVGRVTRAKGVEVLAKAFPLIVERHPDARLVVVGPDFPTPTQSGSTMADVLRLVPPSLRNRVAFEGLRTPQEIAGYYARAAVCVLPSLFDIGPYTCHEAMTFGNAIVGSRNSGMKEMLADGAGLLYTPPDHVELAQHVAALLANPDRAAEMGRRARARALGPLGRDAILTANEAFHDLAIAEARARPLRRSG